jgi:hypothetical protein
MALAVETAATTTEAMVVAGAAAMVAAAVDSARTGNLHNGAFKGTRLCFHHYIYGRQATGCKPPCLFNQGNGAAASSN